MKAKINLKNIYAYIQGNIRYKLYYSKYFKRFIPRHIKEQIDSRIKSMDKECFFRGSCKLCGCQTTHLQCADKACDKPCYPYMFSKVKWERMKEGLVVYDSHTNLMWKLDKENKFEKVL